MPRTILLLLLLSACRLGGDGPLNVVVLYTDDQRYNTIAALGNTEIRTPNLDRLVREGTTFTHAHTMGGMHGALCAPSRSMLMTGRPLFRLLESGNRIPEEHVMMPEALVVAGYATFATGKWHNDRPSFARAFQQADQVFFGGMHWPNQGGHEAPWLNSFDSTGTYAREDRIQVHDFSSQIYADAAIAFLNQAREQDEPFFAYVSFTSPHDPRTPPAPFDSWYTPETVSLPPNYLPEHPFDNGELRVRDEMLREHPRTEDIAREELALYYGMISELDAQIGRILTALEENDQLDNTLIVLAGDNGLAVGSHGLLGKQNLYEHSMRVPLIMMGPGVPRNEQRDALVYVFDIFPTIAEHLGLEVPATVEGESLLPLIHDASLRGRENAFYAYRNLQRGVRTADGWKLIQYDVEGVRTEQLYDLSSDPSETVNLAGDSMLASRLEAMRTLLVDESHRWSDPLDLSQSHWGKSPPEPGE